MELHFKVNEQIIEHLTAEEKKVVEKSKNYLYSRFEFSEDWQGIKKTALFTSAKGETKLQILDDNNMCEVPWEVIGYPHFTVSVFGGDLITVNRCVVDVLKSGYCEGTAPSEPTPDVYSQILDKMTQTEEIAESLVDGENSRVEAENVRVEAEQKRIDDETVRATAEEQRVTNEQNRIEAEEQRETLKGELETLKGQTEQVVEYSQHALEEFESASGTALASFSHDRQYLIDAFNQETDKALEDVENATEKANDAATHQPKIGDNNNWFVWDIVNKVYVDTGIVARTNIVQTTGESETDAMSQKATTESLIDLANKVAPSPASVTLYADRWEQDEEDIRYHQEVAVANAVITPRSKVDLQLSAEQITIFYEKDLAFVAENDNGVVTVYCIGQVPENDYVIQATVSEVIVDA